MYKHYVPDHPASVLVDLLLLHLVDPHQRAKGGCDRHAVKANLGCESAAFLAFPHWPTFEIEIGGAIKWEQRTDVSIPGGRLRQACCWPLEIQGIPLFPDRAMKKDVAIPTASSDNVVHPTVRCLPMSARRNDFQIWNGIRAHATMVVVDVDLEDGLLLHIV